MTTGRKATPSATRAAVLDEFNHRCAVCGAARPQLHHIDEDPNNNAIENLLPLCPNDHLIDQHNPTRRIDPDKLRIFRRFKDPTILQPEFDPLFRRTRFLFYLETRDPPLELERTEMVVAELINFVKALEMGEFYGMRLGQLLDRSPLYPISFLDTPDHVLKQRSEEERNEYHRQLLASRDEALSCIVELLRYQRWSAPRVEREKRP